MVNRFRASRGGDYWWLFLLRYSAGSLPETLATQEAATISGYCRDLPRSAIYVDEQGRADMSWRNVPDNEKPQGR